MGISLSVRRALSLAVACAFTAEHVCADELPWIVLTGAQQAAGDEFFDALLAEQPRFQSTNFSHSGLPDCVPASPCPPGSPLIQPPLPPDAATPNNSTPEYSPQPVEPVAPSPAPAQQPAPVDFNQAFDSQTLLASRDAPAMFGDFFLRLKTAENFSPLPTDRVYLNYSYFENTLLLPGGLDVMRLTTGVEKTFLDGMMSLEARVPFLRSLDNFQVLDFGNIDPSATDTKDWQLGDIQLYLKSILWQSDAFTVTSGLGVSIPTASDTVIFDPDIFQTVTYSNDSVRLLPFISGIYTPNDRLFATTLLQFDFDTNGQGFTMTGSGSLPPGRFNQQQFLFLSQSIGYWVYSANGLRIAPIAELHYNQSLNDADRLGSRTDNITVLNGVLGMTAVLDDRFSISTAYVLPIGAGAADEQFDGEFRLLVNWYYGVY